MVHNLLGSGWTSHTLGALRGGIAALGRRDLSDAVGAYGGFAELAEALRAVNDGEFAEAADELEKEVSAGDGAGVCIRNGAVLDRPDQDACEVDGGTWTPPSADDGENETKRAKKKIVIPDIAEVFSRIITDLTNWAKGAGKAEKNQPEHAQVSGSGMYWFVPNYPAVYQASIDVACGNSGGDFTRNGHQPYVRPPYSYEKGGSSQVLGAADVLNVPELQWPFDRELLNEQYRDFHKDAKTSTTTGGAAVLKQQIDYTAAAERAYRLRHATPIRCIMHHSIRKEAHGHDVGVFQRTLMMVQDNLKASAPPGSRVTGGNPLGPSAGLQEGDLEYLGKVSDTDDLGSVTHIPPEEA